MGYGQFSNRYHEPYNADDIDGYRVFEVIGKPKEIKSSNAFQRDYDGIYA